MLFLRSPLSLIFHLAVIFTSIYLHLYIYSTSTIVTIILFLLLLSISLFVHFTGVVGGVAAAGVIGYVAYTKVFAKGASILSNKAMATQAHVSSDL
jgi:hypothetical protein